MGVSEEDIQRGTPGPQLENTALKFHLTSDIRTVREIQSMSEVEQEEVKHTGRLLWVL